MDEERVVDEVLADALREMAGLSGMQVEVAPLIGQRIRFAIVRASHVVNTYRTRGEIAVEQGKKLYGFEGFLDTLQGAVGWVAIGSLRNDSITHVLLMDHEKWVLIAWVAIANEHPSARG
ncbi:hypothetical protein O7543_24935 [Solwaraspora sp. WMMA2080]|uniref:hypothetical protein n=1 Tax=unclassified Solwaraspora TaxID=2627926 RepID=UPI00248C1CAA|nr:MULTISPECIES: hypothetical protein [unclassified Solwaraspora]WBB96083.1 hypothetical protein O7553_22440 [Solwaraspora sp. WMMA2059]WBC20012.1 hypothetical protein O7543_24935 [Solwaraspora sp. WMMA2080]